MSFRQFKSLLMKSAQIEQQIEKEQKRPWPDWMRLLKLKKVRLSIKDRIQRLLNNGHTGKFGFDGFKSLKPCAIRITKNQY